MKPEEDYIYQLRPDIYQVFLSHITQQDSSVAYFKEAIPKIMSHLMGKLRTEGWNLLDIGCGVGKELIPIIKFLRTFGKVNVYALEPAKKLIDEFKKEAESLGLKDITFINLPWEEYSPDTKFDLIICSHILYHVKEWEPYIQKIIDSLTDEGRAAISLHTRNNLVHQVPVRFLQKIGSTARRHVHHFQELTDLLDKLKISYEVGKAKDTIDITDCKRMNENGQKLVEFFLYYPYEKVPQEIKDEIREYFLSFKEDVVEKEVGFAWASKH